MKLKSKNNLTKEKNNQKNEDHYWNKKYKQIFYWRVKLKRKINLTKGSKKISKEWWPNWKKEKKEEAYHKLGLKNEIEKKKLMFYKGPRT